MVDSGTYTPQTIARRRALAEHMLGRSQGIQDIRSPTQGLAQLANALVGGMGIRRANEMEEQGRGAANKTLAAALAAGPNASIEALTTAASNPWTSDNQQRLISTLLGEKLADENRLDERNYAAGIRKEDMSREDRIRAEEIARENARFGQRLGAPIEVNGQLVNPQTGEIIGDYRTDKSVNAPRPMTPEERDAWGIPRTDRTPYYLDSKGAPQAIGKGGQTINVGSEVGTIPQGYELVTDPETGARRMAPISGGPADTSAKDAAGEEQKQRYGGIVLEDIGRAKDIIKNSTLPTTGMAGDILSNVGGTAARDTKAIIDTIQANVGFDRLQAMRESSPTGGALGAVSERELALLQATLGNLEQSQSQQQLMYNLDRLETLYTDILKKAEAYPNAEKFGFGKSPEPKTEKPGQRKTKSGVTYGIIE